ncbi:MAG: conjugal transfer protein TraR [Thiotrichaceae bacterium]|nr:MAG: conjugal transfer protein TraR [Thiotrichaceae bacterium]
MTDVLDRATETEMRNSELALRNQQESARQTESPLIIEGNRCCLDCEDVVPKKRLKAYPDAVRCVYCQEDFELKEKQINGCC